MPIDLEYATLVPYLTERDTTARIERQAPLLPEPPAGAVLRAPRVCVESGHARQEVLGFGGSFTDAAAHALSRMSAPKREEVIRAYFSPDDGLGYTLCRTHINSCDFALGNYAYADTEGDYGLEHFDIARDRQGLIPLIRDALRVAERPLKLLASPWSPPAWMKTNGDMNHGGKLRPECAEAWARYYARYIQSYAEEGIPVWAVSVQNEPEAKQVWDSCLYTAEEERDFVKNHLGPRLAAEGLGHVKILIWDHNKDVIVRRASTVLDDPDAARYVWGVAFHWYAGDHFDSLAEVYRRYPDKPLLFTEGCVEQGVCLGGWHQGERYAHEMMGDFNNGTVGFIDWNLVLDERGGPNHVGNYCDAPIIADGVTDTLHYQSSYFYLGHFSKFVKPGAVCVASSAEGGGLEAAAFRNPDGQVAIVVMNPTCGDVDYVLALDACEFAALAPRHSIATFLSEAPELAGSGS